MLVDSRVASVVATTLLLTLVLLPFPVAFLLVTGNRRFRRRQALRHFPNILAWGPSFAICTFWVTMIAYLRILLTAPSQ